MKYVNNEISALWQAILADALDQFDADQLRERHTEWRALHESKVNIMSKMANANISGTKLGLNFSESFTILYQKC